MRLVVGTSSSGHVVLHQPDRQALRITPQRHTEIIRAVREDALVPGWLPQAARQVWHLNLTGQKARQVLLIRPDTSAGVDRASWELDLACNFACPHCYLQQRPHESLTWVDRQRIIETLVQAGVLWLQLAGGEPLLDRLFPRTYQAAYDQGMSIRISTNGSLLDRREILDVLTARPPAEITVSLYGASHTVVMAMTGRAVAHQRTIRGIQAAQAAGLPIRARIIVTTVNADEEAPMCRLADRLGIPHRVYRRMSPGIHGGSQPLRLQTATAPETAGKVFAGCSAGVRSLHVDPHGHAYPCPAIRRHGVDLLSQGTAALSELRQISQQLLAAPAASGTCPPLAALHRAAGDQLRQPSNERGEGGTLCQLLRMICVVRENVGVCPGQGGVAYALGKLSLMVRAADMARWPCSVTR